MQHVSHVIIQLGYVLLAPPIKRNAVRKNSVVRFDHYRLEADAAAPCGRSHGTVNFQRLFSF